MRNRDRLIGIGESVLPRYERVAFEKSLLDRPECAWIDGELEKKAAGYAVANVVPEHLAEIRTSRLALIAKTEAAVKDRLTKEINCWDHRAEELKLQEQAGKTGARLISGEARKRADMLQARLRKRLEELKLEAQISPLPPVVLGGLLVVPKGLVDTMERRKSTDSRTAVDTQESATRARSIIMETERNLGFDPTDREFEKLGYDIESRAPGAGKLRFIEVKGRVSFRGSTRGPCSPPMLCRSPDGASRTAETRISRHDGKCWAFAWQARRTFSARVTSFRGRLKPRWGWSS